MFKVAYQVLGIFGGVVIFGRTLLAYHTWCFFLQECQTVEVSATQESVTWYFISDLSGEVSVPKWDTISLNVGFLWGRA